MAESDSADSEFTSLRRSPRRRRAIDVGDHVDGGERKAVSPHRGHDRSQRILEPSHEAWARPPSPPRPRVSMVSEREREYYRRADRPQLVSPPMPPVPLRTSIPSPVMTSRFAPAFVPAPPMPPPPIPPPPMHRPPRRRPSTTASSTLPAYSRQYDIGRRSPSRERSRERYDPYDYESRVRWEHPDGRVSHRDPDPTPSYHLSDRYSEPIMPPPQRRSDPSRYNLISISSPPVRLTRERPHSDADLSIRRREHPGYGPDPYERDYPYKPHMYPSERHDDFYDRSMRTTSPMLSYHMLPRPTSPPVVPRRSGQSVRHKKTTPQETVSRRRRSSARGATSAPALASSVPTPDSSGGPSATLKNELLSSLCSYSPAPLHNHLSTARTEDSGQWLFALPKFERWRSPSEQADKQAAAAENCLWCCGNLGAGKTMLMSAVVDKLTADVKKGPASKSAVVYYYFHRGSPCPVRDFASSLLRQLCEQKDVATPLPWFLADRLVKMEKAHDEGIKNGVRQEQSPLMRLGDILADFLSLLLRFDMVYVCLDGLEECEDLLELLEVLVRLEGSPARLILTARQRIMESGTTAGIGSKELVVVIEDHNSPDLQRYLETVSEDIPCLADVVGGEALQERLRKLIGKSGRNFLAAVAHIGEVGRFATASDVHLHLEKPPLGFPGLFHFIWSRLDDQSVQRAGVAKRVFYWLSVARRPLTFTELQQAVAMGFEQEKGSDSLRDRDRLPPQSIIEKACMGFVHVDAESNVVLVNPSSLPFYLYHFVESFATDAEDCVAKGCLDVLRCDILSHRSFKSQEDYDEMTLLLPLSCYVSQYWGTHVNDSSSEEIKKDALKVLDNETLIDTLSQLLHVNSPTHQRKYSDYPSGFGGRHFGAYFNLAVALEKWPKPGDWEVPKDSWDRTPLHVSLLSPGQFSRHSIFREVADAEIATLVTGREATTTSFDATSETNADEAAAAEGKGGGNGGGDNDKFSHEPVRELPWTYRDRDVDFLVALASSRRGDMATPDKDGFTPIHYAASSWSPYAFLEVCEALSDDVGGLNTDEGNILSRLSDSQGDTILDCACGKNFIIGSMVLHAADWSNEQIGRAMVVAASEAHALMVTSLLEAIEDHNAGPSDVPDLNRSCLEAARRGFTDIVRILRQQGADLGERDADGRTVLHHAACGGHTDTVRYLLLEGADANQLDNAGRTPLFCATEGGNEGIVTLLTEKGASVTATDAEGHTSLQLAARDGNLDVVQKLLRLEKAAAGPPVLVSSLAQAMTPLHLAARGGHGAVVRLLLDHGVAADGGGSTGRTPLSYACEAGCLPAVEALLARNADATKPPEVDLNSRDESGRTPLSYAAAAGHLDTVRLLMGQAKLDANVPDADGGTPLIHAARGRHSDMAILMAASNLDTEGQKASIPAEVLARLPKPLVGGSEAVDLDAVDSCGRTALSYLAEAGNIDAVGFLVSLQANPEIPDAQGKTAADYARSNGHDEVLKVLAHHQEKSSSEEALARQDSSVDGAVGLQPGEENANEPVRGVDRVTGDELDEEEPAALVVEADMVRGSKSNKAATTGPEDESQASRVCRHDSGEDAEDESSDDKPVALVAIEDSTTDATLEDRQHDSRADSPNSGDDAADEQRA